MSASVLASRPALPAKRRGESPAVEAAAIDAHLVRRVAAGDAAAFAEIFQRHRARILSLTFGVLRNRADAEEMTQDTFVRAYRALGNFRGECTLATWLHSIAVNLARNRLRWWRRRPEVSLEEWTDGLDAPAGGANAAELALANERSAAVRDAVAALPVELREALVLFEYEQMAHAEIALAIGATPKAVETRIYRAREKLRGALARWR